MERGSAFPEPLQQQHPETKHSPRTTLRDLTVEGSGSQLQNVRVDSAAFGRDKHCAVVGFSP